MGGSVPRRAETADRPAAREQCVCCRMSWRCAVCVCVCAKSSLYTHFHYPTDRTDYCAELTPTRHELLSQIGRSSPRANLNLVHTHLLVRRRDMQQTKQNTGTLERARVLGGGSVPRTDLSHAPRHHTMSHARTTVRTATPQADRRDPRKPCDASCPPHAIAACGRTTRTLSCISTLGRHPYIPRPHSGNARSCVRVDADLLGGELLLLA